MSHENKFVGVSCTVENLKRAMGEKEFNIALKEHSFCLGSAWNLFNIAQMKDDPDARVKLAEELREMHFWSEFKY
jgi:hypothetical protein